MGNKELGQIKRNISLLRDQKHGMEETRILGPDEEKVRLGQRIENIKADLKRYEQEYWQVLATQAQLVEIDEQEAEVVIGEIVAEVTQIETSSISPYSPEIKNILREIRDQLNQPEPTASAKVKTVISSIPPFVGISYEAELDTESFLRRHFPTFVKVIEKLVKK